PLVATEAHPPDLPLSTKNRSSSSASFNETLEQSDCQRKEFVIQIATLGSKSLSRSRLLDLQRHSNANINPVVIAMAVCWWSK
ncbi:hypothetical protein, partial [Vibrio sp. OPT46]|uniref:hypothetical protein n=1 Tax=Vibrio sp. OPT46 TaxID=2778645 RepID=UPI001D13AB5F